MADTLELSAWPLETTGLSGYNGLPANVQLIFSSTADVLGIAAER